MTNGFFSGLPKNICQYIQNAKDKDIWTHHTNTRVSALFSSVS